MSKTYAFLPELKKVVKCRIDREEEKRDVNSVPEAPRVPTHKTYGEKQAVSSHSRLKTPYNKFEPYTPDPDYPGAKEYYRTNQTHEQIRIDVRRDRNDEPDPDY